MPAETHVEKNPVSRDEVIALIRDQLSEILEIDPDTVELTSAFVDDLGADSLALIERLVEALEGELGERSVGFRIDDEDLEDLQTVVDAVDYVMAKLASASGAGGRARVTATDPVDDLHARLGYTFTDRLSLDAALAHRSWCAENEGNASNERLEFLGDSVLGLVVTDFIYEMYPALPEGELAKVRSSVVNAQALADAALQLDLGSAVRLGKGEDASGGREKPSILSDALEAVIGAIYLDGGWAAAQEFVLRILGPLIEEAAAGPGGQDFKTRLQELAAQHYPDLPRYVVVDEGPDHAKTFHARVFIGADEQGEGGGRSKKQAEQAAARAAWESLRRIDS